MQKLVELVILHDYLEYFLFYFALSSLFVPSTNVSLSLMNAYFSGKLNIIANRFIIIMVWQALLRHPLLKRVHAPPGFMELKLLRNCFVISYLGGCRSQL